jgi:hypothetical protein
MVHFNRSAVFHKQFNSPTVEFPVIVHTVKNPLETWRDLVNQSSCPALEFREANRFCEWENVHAGRLLNVLESVNTLKIFFDVFLNLFQSLKNFLFWNSCLDNQNNVVAVVPIVLMASTASDFA